MGRQHVRIITMKFKIAFLTIIFGVGVLFARPGAEPLSETKIDPITGDLLVESTGKLSSKVLERQQRYQSLLIGTYHYSKGEYKEALREFEKISEAFPDNSAFNLRIARCYYFTGDTDRALETINRILSPETADFDTLMLRGLIYSQKENYDAAQADFEKAESLAPEDITIINELLKIYRRKEDLGNQIRIYEKLLEFRPNSIIAIVFLAETFRKQDNFEKSLYYYRKLVELFPEEPDTLRNMGFLLSKTGKKDEALEIFERVLVIEPHHKTTQKAFEFLLDNKPEVILGRYQKMARENLDNREIQILYAIKLVEYSRRASRSK